MNKLTIGLVIALVISIGFNFFGGDSFGKASGFAHYQHESFLQGLSGGVRDQFSVDNVGVLTSSADLNVDSGDLFVDVSANKVGIGSSTPSTDLSVGTGGATSTISGGNFCAFFQDEAGTGVWITIALNSSNVFATSTTSCN